jgi:hypothetical protein
VTLVEFQSAVERHSREEKREERREGGKKGGKRAGKRGETKVTNWPQFTESMFQTMDLDQVRLILEGCCRVSAHRW